MQWRRRPRRLRGGASNASCGADHTGRAYLATSAGNLPCPPMAGSKAWSRRRVERFSRSRSVARIRPFTEFVQLRFRVPLRDESVARRLRRLQLSEVGGVVPLRSGVVRLP